MLESQLVAPVIRRVPADGPGKGHRWWYWVEVDGETIGSYSYLDGFIPNEGSGLRRVWVAAQAEPMRDRWLSVARQVAKQLPGREYIVE